MRMQANIIGVISEPESDQSPEAPQVAMIWLPAGKMSQLVSYLGKNCSL